MISTASQPCAGPATSRVAPPPSRIRAWTLAACSLLPARVALAQTDAATSVSHSHYEVGLMMLVATAIFVLAGVILRLLARMRVISRIIWILPILILVTGAVWVSLYIAHLETFPSLIALVGFMLLSFVMVGVLYPVARLLLPSRALLTRGGVPPLLRGLAVAVVAFIGMLILLTWVFPGLSLTPMFVTSGVVSIVLGFALQDLLGNLMAGIVLSVERPFKVGDWIRIGAVEGAVTDLTWRATHVRTREGDCALIPNAVAAKETVLNFDQPTAAHLVKIGVGVSYDTPCGLVDAALLDAAANVEELLRTPPPEVYVKDFQDSAVHYELRVWIDNYGSLHGIESRVRRQIWYAFKRYGITIPFPQRDVNVRKVEEVQRASCSRLVVTAGPLAGAMYPLADVPMVIGRSPDCGIVVQDPHVSNQHAVVEPHEGGYRVRDLGSRHGTRLNREPIQEARLEQGDQIVIDPVTIVFETHLIPASIVASGRSRRAAPPPSPPPTSPSAQDATSVS